MLIPKDVLGSIVLFPVDAIRIRFNELEQLNEPSAEIETISPYNPKHKQTFINTELRYHALSYRFKGTDKVYDETFIAGNADCRLFNTMGEQVESFLDYYGKQCDFISVKSDETYELNTIPYENFKGIKSQQPDKFSKTRHVSILRDDKILYLAKQTRCICPDTGIEFYVNMPSPLGANMMITHPFALYANVTKFIKEYQRTGQPIAGLDNTVLAGMLITTMRAKDFAYCRDSTKANKNLARINRKTLTYALNYFYRGSDRIHNPQFSLDDIDQYNATAQILSFIKVCKGEDDTLQTHYMREQKYNSVKAKIIVNQDDKEAAALKKDIKSCRSIFDNLVKAKPISKELRIQLEMRIKGIGYLTSEGKTKLTDDIYSLFGENDATRAFYFIILSNQTDNLSKDLLSLSQELKADDSDAKPTNKIDFKALMGWKKDDDNE